MRIADISRRSSVATSALRYYEAEGLLTPVLPSDAGYRIYDRSALGRVAFIKRAKPLGLTLKEIRQLLLEPTDLATDQVRLRYAAEEL